MLHDPGFGLYIHWPFCAAKCPYCDFNSHVRHGGVDEPRFREALLTELRTVAEWVEKRPLTSIFFGGGTPSLMAPETVGALIDEAAKIFPTAPGLEITLEANPGSVEAGRFRGYRQAGVNRVSLGLQALNDPDLKFLGRIHTVAEARIALGIAFETFERVSFDLIYARPKQTVAQWEAELREALALGPTHLSLYQLTIEEGTPFHELYNRGKLLPPPEGLASDLFSATQVLCDNAGLPAYEVSNHARPGQECRHNLVYWRYGDYLGIGPGAHGRIHREGVPTATATEKNPEKWASLVESNGHGLIEQTELFPSDIADEMLIMGLRLSEGIDLDRLERMAGRRLDPARLARLMDDDFVTVDRSHRLRATEAGRPVLNRLVLELSIALAESQSKTVIPANVGMTRVLD